MARCPCAKYPSDSDHWIEVSLYVPEPCGLIQHATKYEENVERATILFVTLMLSDWYAW